MEPQRARLDDTGPASRTMPHPSASDTVERRTETASGNIDRRKRPPLVPGRRLRNLIARFRDTLGLFQWLHREHGAIVRYKILGLEFCLLSDPEMIDEVLYAKRTAFEKGFVYKRSLLLPRPTLITGDGEDHKQRRRLVQPYFHRKKLATYSSIMADQAVAMRNRWNDGEIFDVDNMAHELTLSISLKIFFGDKALVDAEMLKKVLKLCVVDAGSALLPSQGLRRLILSSCRRLRRAHRNMTEQVAALIESARAEGSLRSDFVTHMALATDENGEFAFSRDEVADEVVEMLLASLVTTATTMGWATYYLARNRTLRERIEHEVDDTLKGRVPALEDYGGLRFTGAVIAEVLRLAPPAYYLGRQAIRDCTVGGYYIPAGANLQLFPFLSQRDERYFPQAETFRPERWLESQATRPRCSYMPFGSGTRDCAGEAFARLNLTFALASIAQRWRLDLVSEEFPKLNTLASYAFKDGLLVKARAREHA